MRSIATSIVMLALAGCSREVAAPEPSPAQPTPSAPVAQTSAAPVTPTAPVTPPPSAPTQVEPAPAAPAGAVNQSTPDGVMNAVFAAARTQQYAPLAALCAPNADGDTQRICSVPADAGAAAEFQRYFATGRVTGPAVVTGTDATVPFSFGPSGNDTETMQLVQISGAWFMREF